MIITLSEKRNEKLVFDWAEEMTEQHAQDFCDVCNVVFKHPNYTAQYILERFGVNIYGGGFICTAYKDDKPLACLGGIRNDLDGKPAIQLEHFATLPQVRKSGYNVDLIWHVLDEVEKRHHDALIYGFPNEEARAVDVAAGFAPSKGYQRIFHGATKDFLQNMHFIDDDYAQAFTLKKKKAAILTINGKCYACFPYLAKGVIPSGLIVGEVSPKFKGTVPDAGRLRIWRYHSLTPGLLGDTYPTNIVTYQLGASKQENNPIPPLYKTCHSSSDFFGGRY